MIEHVHSTASEEEFCRTCHALHVAENKFPVDSCILCVEKINEMIATFDWCIQHGKNENKVCGECERKKIVFN